MIFHFKMIAMMHLKGNILRKTNGYIDVFLKEPLNFLERCGARRATLPEGAMRRNAGAFLAS
jgi:hypothetical protein